ncbi:MAG: tetratricopeptide repeat protein [Hyphomonadaceae bacterium]
MTNETDSFVNEVQESLRQDRMLALAKKYGPWLLGAFVAVIIGVGGWQAWRGVQTNAARAHAEDFTAAQQLVQSRDLDGAKAAFERLSNEGPQVYRVMAMMEHAALLELQGDLEASVAEFDRAASQTNDPIMRQSAQMRAAYIAAETEDYAGLQRRLQPIIDDGGRFSYLARELLAIEAWKAGQIDTAREGLQALTLAFDAPDAVRQRAQVALAVIGPGETPSADGATDAPAPSEGESK